MKNLILLSILAASLSTLYAIETGNKIHSLFLVAYFSFSPLYIFKAESLKDKIYNLIILLMLFCISQIESLVIYKICDKDFSLLHWIVITLIIYYKYYLIKYYMFYRMTLFVFVVSCLFFLPVAYCIGFEILN